jgi:hypothetical protein
MQKPEPCGKCGAEAVLRKTCPKCGQGEWVIQHGAHYMQGAREVFDCPCPSPHSALGRRKAAIKECQAARVKAGKPADWNRPVSTPEMAKTAALALANGMSAPRALRLAGFPPSTVKRGKAGINRMVRAELKTLGRKYIELGRDLSPEDQAAIVRGRLLENTIIGTDAGVQSAKQLGADKRISMWQPDSQVGLVILGSPPEVRKMKHEVPWLEPEFHDDEEEPPV